MASEAGIYGQDDYENFILRGGARFYRVAEVCNRSRKAADGTPLAHILRHYTSQNIPVLLGKESGSTVIYAKV